MDRAATDSPAAAYRDGRPEALPPLVQRTADLVDGDTATFPPDLLQTLAGLVTLEVECDS